MFEIPRKETITVEFKSDIKSYPDNELVEEIVGMANAKGGSLYLGIEDDGEITGILKKHEDAIGAEALVANKTIPSVSVRAEILTVESKNVLKIDVPASRAVISTSSGKMLRRRLKVDGTPETVPMFAYEIKTRLSELSLLDFSAKPIKNATMADFDTSQRARLRSIIQSKPGGEKNLLGLSEAELDKALHLTTEIDGKEYPTLTGMLILGKEERINELIPTAKSAFQVLEGTKVKVNLETSAPILDVCEKFETYMDAWNPENEIEAGLLRVAVPEFDKAAFREGIVNAFSHRDYTVLGRIRVLIDDEGLTISSPGGFIDGVTLENLLVAEPHGKNPALADALKRIGLAEKTGRGIDRIYEGSIIYGRPWPDYSGSTTANVRLFIQRARADKKFTELIMNEQNRLGRPLSIYALMILSLLKMERRGTIERMVSATHLNEFQIRSSVENLLEIGIVEGIGNGKSRAYMLSEKLYRKSEKSVQYVRQKGIDRIRYPEMILKLAKTQAGFITKQDVVDLLNLSGEQAYREISGLVKAGKLCKIYGGRYAKYRLI